MYTCWISNQTSSRRHNRFRPSVTFARSLSVECGPRAACANLRRHLPTLQCFIIKSGGLYNENDSLIRLQFNTLQYHAAGANFMSHQKYIIIAILLLHRLCIYCHFQSIFCRHFILLSFACNDLRQLRRFFFCQCQANLRGGQFW